MRASQRYLRFSRSKGQGSRHRKNGHDGEFRFKMGQVSEVNELRGYVPGVMRRSLSHPNSCCSGIYCPVISAVIGNVQWCDLTCS